jgi:hypothetical protein
MNIDLTREEVERIVKSLNENPQTDLIDTILVQKLQRHFPPQTANSGDMNEVVCKYQQFGR